MDYPKSWKFSEQLKVNNQIINEMKNHLKYILSLLILVNSSAYGYHFEFEIEEESERTCNVSALWAEENENEQVLVIPEKVTIGKAEYKVVAIQENALTHYKVLEGSEGKEGVIYFWPISKELSGHKGLSQSTISIPCSVSKISQSLYDNDSITNPIEVDKNNPFLSSINGVLYDKAGTQKIPYKVPNDSDEEDVIYMRVQMNAKFPNLTEYIQQNIQYPKPCKKKKIEGTVLISCYIEKNGQVSDVEVTQSVHELLDEEALRIIKGMPQWTPAEENARRIRQKVTIPVKFSRK